MSIGSSVSKYVRTQIADRYVKDVSWLVAERILRMSMGLFVGVWVARYLGPREFGLFSYAQSMVGLFAVFSTLGLNGLVVREMVSGKVDSGKLLGSTFILKLAGSIFVVLLLCLVVGLQLNSAGTRWLILIISSSAIFQSFNVIDLYFQSKVLSKNVACSNFFVLILSSIFKIILIVLNAPLLFFAYIVVFDSIILALSLVYFYLKDRKIIPCWSFDKAVAKKLLVSCWPLIFSGLFVSLYMKIDQVMIDTMLGASAVGEYAAAVKLSEAWYFIPVVIASSVFPAIITAKNKSSALYSNRLAKLYAVVVWAAIFIAVLVTLAGDQIVGVLYGDDFRVSAEVLKIHIWSGIFVFLGVTSSKWLLCENIPIYSMYNTIIGVLINVALNYILLDLIGVVGAAWATLVAYFFSGYLCFYFFYRTRSNFFLMSKSVVFSGKFYAKESN